MTTQGEIVKRMGKRGKGQGDFNLPMDVALGTDNKLYVLDQYMKKMEVYKKLSEEEQQKILVRMSKESL